jgi:hypothetical protein
MNKCAGAVVQHVGELPGGPLEVQVYTGANGTFTLHVNICMYMF